RRVEAVEALLRWNQEDVEAIPPSVFVPVLEKLGLITEVGAWALDAAAAQLKQWDALGLPPLVASVNISPHQFENGDLVEVVNDVLSRRSLAATRMELELTESTLMRNTRASNVTLRDLKDRGLRLAIDDFGTGYSSLAYLSRFRVDVLKVDRSFVQEIGRSDDSDAIISAILSLGQQLNLEVTAEGIETDEQLAFIEERGCHRAQGYLFCRPVSAAKIEELLGRGGTP
ncbi:MAG: EAL domain-containing protein, partial [Myxococcota bacterium]